MHIKTNWLDAERTTQSLAQHINDAMALAGSDTAASLTHCRHAANYAHMLARFLDNLANGLAAEAPAERPVSQRGVEVEEHQKPTPLFLREQAPVAREPRVKEDRQRTVGDEDTGDEDTEWKTTLKGAK